MLALGQADQLVAQLAPGGGADHVRSLRRRNALREGDEVAQSELAQPGSAGQQIRAAGGQAEHGARLAEELRHLLGLPAAVLVAAAGAERDDASGAAANGQLEREPAPERVADEVDGAFEP